MAGSRGAAVSGAGLLPTNFLGRRPRFGMRNQDYPGRRLRAPALGVVGHAPALDCSSRWWRLATASL
eukprot:12418399-Karenia_brevis.AAC.1